MSGDRIKLEVRPREELGSRHTRRLRKQGLIPGVLYGNGEPVAIVVGERELRTAVTGPSGLHAILDVVVEGRSAVHPSVLSDYQRDPIRGTLSHFDLREVRLDRPITATVTINLVGEPVGAKTGGVLSLVGRELQVEALPGDVPEHIDVDVSSLEVGDVLRLEDIPKVEKVTFLDDPHETVIATVSIPRGLVEPEEEELEEGEEVEGEAEEGAPEASAEDASESEASDEE
jgi:large subunit ribosomal protein L25